MAHYASEGVFEAPADKIWRLIDEHTPERVGQIHEGFVGYKVVERRGNAELREATSLGPDGKPLTYRVTMVFDRPRSLTIVWETGPLTGSWVVHAYVPDGLRTRLHAVGDVRVAGLDEAAARRMVSEALDRAFDEDAAWLRRMR